ncbi:MAG: rhodanese-like domain-containing protein [Bacteroidales bacterium]|nr:rhodanese-like domain-containing protein [Bacteroidales bacterium]
MITTIKPRILLVTIALILGMIIAAVPENTTKPFMLTANELLDEIKTRTQFLHPDIVADMMVNKDPLLRLIDVRSRDDYEKYSLPGAINIPVDNILDDEFTEMINQGTFMNVFFSNGSTLANEAWLITRQLGYNNNFVLEGGLNYWTETILNPEKPGSAHPDDEFAKYDFRKAAGRVFGGGGPAEIISDTTDKASKPMIIPTTRKKKTVQGGCS